MSKTNNQIFNSLMPMFGGKRKLAKYILPHLASVETIADVFFGGGSISLACKAHGKQVYGNDIARRSKVIGNVILLAKDSDKITEEDVFSLFLPTAHDNFIESHFAPKYMPTETARYLDLFFANARKRNSPKREILEFLLMRFCMVPRQFGSWGHNADTKMIEGNKVIELLELCSEARARKVGYMISPPLPILLKLKDDINIAIFSNGKKHEMHMLDCFEFLEKMKREGKKIDAAYYDSPYAFSLKYSQHMKILDEILEGKTNLGIKDGAFNGKEALENFEKLFALSEFIPKWVISMGYNPSKQNGIRGEELLAVVQKFRPAKLYYLNHVWVINNIVNVKVSNSKGKKSTETKHKKQDENCEYLIVTK